MSRRARKPIFKACRKCGGLVKLDVNVCPYCGSNSFSEDWSGIVIVRDPEHSIVATIVNRKEKPGIYAIKVAGKVVLK